MCLMVSLYFAVLAPREPITEDIHDLTYAKVIKAFDDHVPYIVVMHGEGLDTIHNQKEFVSLRDRVEAFRAETAVNQVGVQGTFGNSRSNENMPILRLDISGARKVNEQLRFTIEDYDQNFEYLLSYGGENPARNDAISVISYSRPGTYLIRLIATDRDDPAIQAVYTKRIVIRPQSDRQPKFAEINTKEKYPFNPALSPQQSEKPGVEVSDIDDAFGPPTQIVEPLPVIEEDDGFGPVDEGAEDEAGYSTDVLVEDKADKEPAEKKAVVAVEIDENDDAGSTKRDGPYVTADVMPQFPGGSRAMTKYFSQNYDYPKVARQMGIEGTVIMRFIVQPDGTLSDFHVIKGVKGGCSEEALRLIKNMPRWTPGRHEGEAIPVYKVVPVHFKLMN